MELRKPDIDPTEAKRRSRGYSTDMSPEAVDRRLRIASEMRDACLELMKWGRAAREGATSAPTPPPEER